MIATITDVDWADFPWACGKFVAADMEPQIRDFLEWIGRESKTENGITEDPPFEDELFDEWFIENPDGTRTAIMMPVLDFLSGAIEWR
ncbi:MAG: hypothetical protein AAGD25_07365 [Cyanobacteria bacterium P01_F01_bin.150]